MGHTYFHFDGFEVQADANDEARWQSSWGSAPSVDLTNTSYSRAALRWNLSGASGFIRILSERDGAGAWVDDASPEAGVWESFHIRFASLPGAGQFYYLCRTGDASAQTRAALRINGNNSFLEVYSDGSETWEAGSVALATGTWYIVSFKSFQGTAPIGIVRNRDTGVTVDSKTHSAALGGGVIPRYIDLGPYDTSTGDASFDNWVVESDASAANIDDPVNDLTTKYACGLLLPDGAGSYDQWTGTYADVDEVPHDDTTTVRSESTAGDVFTQTLASTASLAAQVGSIKASMHFAFVAGSSVSTQLRIRSGGTDVDGTDYTPAASFTCSQLLRTTDPATSTAWMVSGVDSVEVGVEKSGGAGTANCTLCGMEILYTITAVSRQPRVAYVLDVWDPRQRIYDEMGRRVPYNEVRANRWMRVLGVDPPTTYLPSTFVQDPSMTYIERAVYTQEGEKVSLGIEASPDDFVSNLIRRLNDRGSGV